MAKKPVKIYGEDNAHITDDYPYGFRLRTQRKEWIESKMDKKGNLKGQRECFQTKNPKTNEWNKPKCGTYSDVIVGYLEHDPEIGKETIHFRALRMNAKEDEIKAFETEFNEVLLPEQRKTMKDMIAWDRGMKHVEWKIDPESTQTLEDQREILSKVWNLERAKMMKEAKEPK